MKTLSLRVCALLKKKGAFLRFRPIFTLKDGIKTSRAVSLSGCSNNRVIRESKRDAKRTVRGRKGPRFPSLIRLL
jgi:hypothetical protein